jgi:hypothetical protein
MQTTDLNETYASNFNRLLNFCVIAKANGTRDHELFPECILELFEKHGFTRIGYYLQGLTNESLDDFSVYMKAWQQQGLPLPSVGMMNDITEFLLDPTDFWQR